MVDLTVRFSMATAESEAFSEFNGKLGDRENAMPKRTFKLDV
jgi:hypothetical protein